LLKTATFSKIKPESMKSFELGYKALISKKLLIDVYGIIASIKILLPVLLSPGEKAGLLQERL
jgi:hypothetical protein